MVTNFNATICALITPAGKGAVAVIRISGNETFSIIEKIFHPKNKSKKISKAASHTLHLGNIKNNDILIDEVLLSVFRNPYSYTGEDVIEISCHGSVFIQHQILKLLLTNGAQMAQPGEFTMRAFFNGKLDLAQAEAVADIIASESESSHMIAMQQMRGGFSNTIKELRNELTRFAAMIELELDFSEEDVEFASREDLKSLVERIMKVISDLFNSFEMGNILKNGVSVAIAGKPNTGKSTLLNVLLNDERAIVSEIAGTTRDTIEDEITIKGIRFRFIDTAGIRETKDVIESLGIERTFERIKNAAVVIYLFDPNETDPDELNMIVSQLKQQTKHLNLFPVANKIDRHIESEVQKKYSAIKNLICISAKNKVHINVLLEALLNIIPAEKINSGENFISNARHAHALSKANWALQNVIDELNKKTSNDFIATDIRHALNYLGEITGEISNDSLLDFIFSKFCIGK